MIVYSLLYLRYFHYFVNAHAYCKRICWMLLGVITYVSSEERRTDDVTTNTILLCYKTNRFYVAVRLFSLVAHEAQPSVSLMFSPRCDIILIHCLTHARQHRIYSQIGSCSIDEISIDNWLHIFAHFQGVSRRSLFCSFLHIFWQNLQGDCFALQSCH